MKIKYQSNDHRLFDTEPECVAHERAVASLARDIGPYRRREITFGEIYRNAFGTKYEQGVAKIENLREGDTFLAKFNGVDTRECCISVFEKDGSILIGPGLYYSTGGTLDTPFTPDQIADAIQKAELEETIVYSVKYEQPEYETRTYV